MAGLDLVTAPADEPVTLEAAKLHLRVEADDEDSMIAVYLAAARNHVETFLKSSLLETAWRYRIDGGFPWEIRLPIGPVLTADGLAITYVDDAGATQTLDPSVYKVALGETGIIRPAYSQVWPFSRRESDAVTVAFKAGWPNAAAVPQGIVAAVLLMTGHLYQNREATAAAGAAMELPLGVRNLLMPFVRND